MNIARVLVLGSLVLAACTATGQPNRSAAYVADSRWAALGETSVAPREAPRLHFLADGRLDGYSGCNRIGGSWRVEAGEIKVSGLSSTKRMCGGPGDEVERRFMAALAGRVSMEGDKLVVSGANERVELVHDDTRY